MAEAARSRPDVIGGMEAVFERDVAGPRRDFADPSLEWRRLFSELLVDVVAAEVIEPWGGGKWHMEIFRSVNPEPEDWNGEM